MEPYMEQFLSTEEGQARLAAKRLTQKIETELEKVCQDVLDVLDESLITKAESGESKVFYHKMYVLKGFAARCIITAESPG